MPPAPKVFVSYSWDDDTHKSWVRDLATRLRTDGVDVTLDQWDLVPGDQIPAFMERAVTSSDFVLIVCTPNYKRRSDARLGGVGYEGDIMTAEVLTEKNHRKFIPILRSNRWDNASPTWLRGSRYIDLCGIPLPPQSYLYLLQTISGALPVPPPLGKLPAPAPSAGIVIAPRDSVTIIIPVYNEAHILRGLMGSLRSLLDKYEVIICDDGSTDNSFVEMRKYSHGIANVRCIRNKYNTRKVGAIDRMARLARTPFVFTLDADCSLLEISDNALDELATKMAVEDISASYFRIIPNDRGRLERLQRLDYLIFTDTLRRILRVPICLIGQGVLWRKDSLLKILSKHSGKFDGDDLENTVLALGEGMNLYWERKSIILTTEPKRTLIGLVKQRALSWDFGMLRVLLTKRALQLGGESGAFYKNILLLDFVAHPLRLIALPLLLSVPLANYYGAAFYDGAANAFYRNSLSFCLKYGALGILFIWVLSILNSFLCTRHLRSTAKWAAFCAVYLSSPFAYIMFFPLVSRVDVNAFDTLGAAAHWLGLGILITYFWWVALTLCLLFMASIEMARKVELLSSVLLAPPYYLLLLVVCKTIGIVKRIFGR